MSTTPYSDQWREHTCKRMASLGIERADVVEATGLPNIAVFYALQDAEVSIEVAGPIDELLDRLERRADAAALVSSEVFEVERVDVCIGALVDARVQLARTP